jgi:carboxymethylenebutenolidase
MPDARLCHVLLAAALMMFAVACGPGGGSGAAASDGSTSIPSQTVTFASGALTLHGLLYKPKGEGPFPAVLYNHGSAAGMLNTQAFDAIAPVFVARGWVFFAPYRRGQGLSTEAGPYIMDEISTARLSGGPGEADRTMTRLLSTDHLDDQSSAYRWLRAQPYIRRDAIAAMGNSFGGIETVLGAARLDYCAAVDAAGGAESWEDGPALRRTLTAAASVAKPPMLFFQAENDFNLAPSRTLDAARHHAGLPSEVRIYPSFGHSPRDGHSFAYRGVAVWRDDVLEFLQQHCRAARL